MTAAFLKKHGHPIYIQVVDEEVIEYILLPAEEEEPPKPPSPWPVGTPRGRRRAAQRIQAWWRGTLVRRALLHAALRAWQIQRWWRRRLEGLRRRRRREALLSFALRERAAVRLQALVRMWRVRWRYAQVLGAIYVIRCHWQSHSCRTCALLRGRCVATATHLQFHIEVTGARGAGGPAP
ncbi:IQ domain-containing protein F2 [Pipistrellus kuhlii]|uniref:IQ domain-containing protein F2 n=1 Tax=Pipistrellus kuhlii TaxID=59472 RepID=UPI00174F1E96|nr:IQ domain-containing protein F2 [Pipistrellus kuhlii]